MGQSLRSIWLTDGRLVQSESSTCLTDRRFDLSETLLCLCSHPSVPDNLGGRFPPSMVDFGFSILRVRGLGLLRILTFPNKKSVYFLSLIDLPSLSWIERINTVTQRYWPAEGTPGEGKASPLRRYSILSSNTNYYLNAKIAACTRLKFFNQLRFPLPQRISKQQQRNI